MREPWLTLQDGSFYVFPSVDNPGEVALYVDGSWDGHATRSGLRLTLQQIETLRDLLAEAQSEAGRRE